MIVAQLRGVEFEFLKGTSVYAHPLVGTVGVLQDVARWLGFNDPDEYLRQLPKEREKIFERAK